MNLYKEIQVQAKSMEANWSSDCVGERHGNFMNGKKCSTCGKYFNTLIASDVSKVLNINKSSKGKLRTNLTWIPIMIILNLKT